MGRSGGQAGSAGRLVRPNRVLQNWGAHGVHGGTWGMEWFSPPYFKTRGYF